MQLLMSEKYIFVMLKDGREYTGKSYDEVVNSMWDESPYKADSPDVNTFMSNFADGIVFNDSKSFILELHKIGLLEGLGPLEGRGIAMESSVNTYRAVSRNKKKERT